MLRGIPNIAHFYWDGSRMSYLQYLTVVSFHKWNPDWKIRVYTPMVKYQGKATWASSEQQMVYTGINYYPMFKRLKYVETVMVDFDKYNIQSDIPETYKSDLLRWHLLADEGGLWSDMDILYLKPMSQINAPSNTQFTISRTMAKINTSAGYIDKAFHIIGFYLTVANNPFFQHIVQNAPLHLKLNNYQSVGATLLNQLYPSDFAIKSICKDMRYIVISMDVVYAYPPHDELSNNQLPALFAKKDLSRITRNTIGIHWYNGHDMAKTFNNEFNHFTMDQFDNTITHYIKILNKDAEIVY